MHKLIHRLACGLKDSMHVCLYIGCLSFRLKAQLQAQKQQEHMQLNNEMSYNEALIDERDQGIAEIQQQIGEVNEIFQVCSSSTYHG